MRHQELKSITLRLLLILSSIVPPSLTYAHPVSFEGGTMLMGTYSNDWIEHDVNYTFSPSSSVGVTQFRIDDGESDRDFIIPRFSHRLRENGLDYQANLYLTAGLGSRIDTDDTRLTEYVSVQADYETRRIYTLGLAESLFDDDGEPRTHLQYRLGFAPYKTHFDGVSTWLIGQIDYRPYRDEQRLSISPVLRFFHRNILIEIGVDLDGGAMGTWMYNF